MLTRYPCTIGRRAVGHVLEGMYYIVRLHGPYIYVPSLITGFYS